MKWKGMAAPGGIIRGVRRWTGFGDGFDPWNYLQVVDSLVACTLLVRQWERRASPRPAIGVCS